MPAFPFWQKWLLIDCHAHPGDAANPIHAQRFHLIRQQGPDLQIATRLCYDLSSIAIIGVKYYS